MSFTRFTARQSTTLVHRRKSMSAKTTILLVFLLLSFGCATSFQLDSAKSANDKLDELERDFSLPASTISAYRVGLDSLDEIQNLVRLEKAPEVALQRLSRDVTATSDEMVAVLAYVIEKRNHRPAIPTLEAYLKSNPGDRGHRWGGTFATRALIKLKNIPDGSGGYENYDDAMINEAIFGASR